MSRIEPDIAAWQRTGALFGSADECSVPGDRLCVETHNVYHHDRMVQVGPYFVHKAIYSGHFHPPKAEDYETQQPGFGTGRTVALIAGLAVAGLGVGLILPV